MGHSSDGPSGGLTETDLAAVMSGENGAFVEALFEDYMTGRGAVPENWIRIFDDLIGRNGANGAPAVPVAQAVQGKELTFFLIIFTTIKKF